MREFNRAESVKPMKTFIQGKKRKKKIENSLKKAPKDIFLRLKPNVVNQMSQRRSRLYVLQQIAEISQISGTLGKIAETKIPLNELIMKRGFVDRN